jgi:hypothetical protein
MKRKLRAEADSDTIEFVGTEPEVGKRRSPETLEALEAAEEKNLRPALAGNTRWVAASAVPGECRNVSQRVLCPD